MGKIKLYITKFYRRVNTIFKITRIKKYGLKIALLDFFIFLMHRNDSDLEHFLIRKKDVLVQKYIYYHYEKLIKEYKGK